MLRKSNRTRFYISAGLLIHTLIWSQLALGQGNYPIQGQLHGGDRRGTYYSEGEDAKKSYDEDRVLPRLYQDPRLYLHNMTLLAHVPGRFYHAGMMTLGDKRYIVSRRKIVDVTNPEQPVIITDQAPNAAELAYNQKLKMWVLMEPGTEGVTFYDVTDPRNIKQLSHFSTGPGSAGTRGDGNYYDGGRYAYLASGLPGTRNQLPEPTSWILQIIDVDDIRNPTEVSRWWVPGQMQGEEAEFLKWPEAKRFQQVTSLEPPSPDWEDMYLAFNGPCIVPKRVEDGGNRAYCAWMALGMRILDLSDIKQPKLVGTWDISPPFDKQNPVHTAYPMPQRKLAFVNGENVRWNCHESIAMPWVVDLRSEGHPATLAAFPIPKPPAEAPYNDFCFRGGRFATHTAQAFKAPGEARIDLMGYAWMDAGWRLYDVSDPFRPEEVAWILPPQGTYRGTEAALIEWDRKVIHVSGDMGLWILSTPVLGEPVLGPLKPQRWSPEGFNAGAP